MCRRLSRVISDEYRSGSLLTISPHCHHRVYNLQFSNILFVMGMWILTRSTKRETRGPRIKSGIYQPPIRTFMDNLTTTTYIVKKLIYKQDVFCQLWEVAFRKYVWSSSQRNLDVLRKGCFNRPVNMQDQGKEIQLNAWEDTKKRLKTWLKIVDGSWLPGRY